MENTIKTKSFKEIGKIAVLSCLAVGIAISAASTINKQAVDDVSFNVLNKAVFQTNHDYMKNEYSAFIHQHKTIPEDILQKELAAADQHGFFNEPQKFKVGMEYFKEHNGVHEEKKSIVQSLRDKFTSQSNDNKNTFKA